MYYTHRPSPVLTPTAEEIRGLRMEWYLCGRNVKCTQFFQLYSVHIKPDVLHVNNYLRKSIFVVVF